MFEGGCPLEECLDELMVRLWDEDDEFTHSYVPSDFPERVTIIGGGPAGMSAAIYAARSGLKPVGE